MSRWPRCLAYSWSRWNSTRSSVAGSAPDQRSPEYLAQFLPQDVERWGKALKAAGISVD